VGRRRHLKKEEPGVFTELNRQPETQRSADWSGHGVADDRRRDVDRHRWPRRLSSGESGKLQRFTFDGTAGGTAVGPRLREIFADREGVIWFGYLTRGRLRFDPQAPRVEPVSDNMRK
jgi:hypothetical protein